MTVEQAAAFGSLRALAAPGRLRVWSDLEGFPIIPGTRGQIEWHTRDVLAVYTARPRLVARLWAIPGVRRHQVGDGEARGLFPPDCLAEVAAVIRARRRRPGPPSASLRNLVGARLRRPSEAQARAEGARATPWPSGGGCRPPAGGWVGGLYLDVPVRECARRGERSALILGEPGVSSGD